MNINNTLRWWLNSSIYAGWIVSFFIFGFGGIIPTLISSIILLRAVLALFVWKLLDNNKFYRVTDFFNISYDRLKDGQRTINQVILDFFIWDKSDNIKPKYKHILNSYNELKKEHSYIADFNFYKAKYEIQKYLVSYHRGPNWISKYDNLYDNLYVNRFSKDIVLSRAYFYNSRSSVHNIDGKILENKWKLNPEGWDLKLLNTKDIQDVLVAEGITRIGFTDMTSYDITDIIEDRYIKWYDLNKIY